MSNKVLIINGPNLNLLAKRNPAIYGAVGLKEIEKDCKILAKQINLETTFYQSNSEAELIDFIHQAIDNVDGIIINAGAYTHSSIAIRDALEIFQGAKIELHISNIFKREEFRHNSYLSSVVDALISGLGVDGYSIALLAINNILNKKKCKS